MISESLPEGTEVHVSEGLIVDDERHGFGFELARVTRLGTFVAAMQQFVRLCSNAHKRTYVLQLVMSDRTSFF